MNRGKPLFVPLAMAKPKSAIVVRSFMENVERFATGGLIQQMQQFYCPVMHDLLLRRILFNSAYMMEEG